MMNDVHEAKTTFPLSIHAPRAARRWLHASGVVPADLADAVDLVVSELVANSVTHSGLSAPNVVSVGIASSDGGVTGVVVDHGRGLGEDQPRDADSMGLRIVDRTASRWGHADHPTRVWFELTPEGERPTPHRRAA
jgi:two-component sensor histidine kinase